MFKTKIPFDTVLVANKCSNVGGLRDDFRTMDWVNVKEELGKYSLNNILI